MIKIINNVLTTQDCFSLYNGLIKANMWTLHMASADYVGGRFPGVSLIGDGEVRCNQPYWLGYFNCLFDRINQKLKEQHNFSISSLIFLSCSTVVLYCKVITQLIIQLVV